MIAAAATSFVGTADWSIFIKAYSFRFCLLIVLHLMIGVIGDELDTTIEVRLISRHRQLILQPICRRQIIFDVEAEFYRQGFRLLFYVESCHIGHRY